MEDQLTKELTEFSVTVYGDLEKYNDVASRARVRIFYKYGNRNGSYITDEFAEKLLASLPYTPVKGIYDGDDYTDHGYSRQLGRIYGIVPEDPHVTWEKFLDEDGVEREYACADVLLFTALYEEAGEIIGKSQSMELYEKSIVGDWKFVDGKRYYVFEDGCFLGLQVLGKEVEPCFEGAAFFSLYDSLSQMIQKIEQYNANLPNKSQGGNTMPKMVFKISDNQKWEMIWTLLNPNFNEENGWLVENSICEIYDDYAVVFNYETAEHRRVYYTKNDETDSLELGEIVRCYIVDVTESEKTALDTIQKLNNGTYEKADEVFTTVENLTKEKAEFEQKIVDLDAQISTLTTERDNAVAQYTEANTLLEEAKANLETAQASLSTLQTERDELSAYKKGIELKEKQAILESYSTNLSEEILNSFSEKLDEYTSEELDMRLAYELKKSNPTIFTQKEDNTNIFIPKDTGAVSGLEGILSKYKK